jgi:hypothetical protein
MLPAVLIILHEFNVIVQAARVDSIWIPLELAPSPAMMLPVIVYATVSPASWKIPCALTPAPPVTAPFTTTAHDAVWTRRQYVRLLDPAVIFPFTVRVFPAAVTCARITKATLLVPDVKYVALIVALAFNPVALILSVRYPAPVLFNRARLPPPIGMVATSIATTFPFRSAVSFATGTTPPVHVAVSDQLPFCAAEIVAITAPSVSR